MVSQVRRMAEPHTVHNNCSGKHASMLILDKLMSDITCGYTNLTNAAQQKILNAREFIIGLDLMQYPHGIDGCCEPVFLARLGNWASAFGYPIKESVTGFFQPKLLNWAGDEVGDITTPDFVLTGQRQKLERSLCQINL